MKPLKLTIEGINSFNEARTVDFEQLSSSGIFCICGPTGSGKTTILDSVILALYAPPSHHRGTLKDYVNTKCDKGKITLDFVSDGVRYRVYREIRRNSSSAARLTNLDNGEIIADKADTVTEAVKKMLKLDKDDFTKVVVLEQGKYAEFMSLGKTKRCETVSKLFSLERFDRLKKTLSDAKDKYEKAVGETDAALKQYEGDTQTALDFRKHRLIEIKKESEKLQKDGALAEKLIKEKEEQKASAERRAAAEKEFDSANDEIKVITEAQKAALIKEAELTVKSAALAGLKQKSDSAHALISLIAECKNDQKDIEEKSVIRDKLRADFRKADDEVKKLETEYESKTAAYSAQKEKLEAEIESAEKLTNSAKEEYESARLLSSAAAVRDSLGDGDVCPVCGGTYHGGEHCAASNDETLLRLKNKYESAEKNREALKEKLKKCESEQMQYNQTHGVAAANASAARDKIKEDGQRIKSEIDKLTAKITERLGGMNLGEAERAANTDISVYESAYNEYNNLVKAAGEEKANIAARLASARARKVAAENTLKELPAGDFDSQAYDNALGALKVLREKAAELTREFGTVSNQIEMLGERLDKKKELARRKKELTSVLDNVLVLNKCTERDNKLLQFVAEEYVQSFTYSASETLSALTGGKYVLVYDDGEFYVQDFFADNARRKVKTLSGGETFLASMSIAMAISREIATQNYEFFFLDEGFGTLHERALETVVAALTDLSKDTTVGIVTHRTELADRIPARLTVTPATEDEGSDLTFCGI